MMELNTFMTQTSIRSSSKGRYISSFRQYHKYCITNNFDPWCYYTSPQYWCYYLLTRVRTFSYYVFKTDRRGISFIYMDCLKFGNPFDNEYFKIFHRKIRRVYEPAPSERLPILLYHHIMFMKYHKVTRGDAWSMPLDILLDITIDQLMGFCGRRCGEIVVKGNTNYLLIDNVTFHDKVWYVNRYYNKFWLKIIHCRYKNQRNYSDYMFSIVGSTSHLFIDPYYFLFVYLQRRKQLGGIGIFQYKPDNPLLVLSTGRIYSYYFLQKRIIDVYKEHIMRPEDKARITGYSLRIGLNVMLEERDISQGRIMDYVGWVRSSNSSQIIYTNNRMPLLHKINVISDILSKKIVIGDIAVHPEIFN